MSAPPWCKLQYQSRGSYRAEDVVDFLDWVLPQSSCLGESVVVLLDWFSAHLADEVQALIHAKGHVLLHHGGGTTGIEQINATSPGVFHWLGGEVGEEGEAKCGRGGLLCRVVKVTTFCGAGVRKVCLC